jgi:cyclin-dependent kinase 1
MTAEGDVPTGLVSRAPLNWYSSPDDETVALGSGTYGQVFRYPIKDAKGEVLAEVAVKVASSDKATDFYYGISESLVREMTMMSGLRHPNVISLLDAFCWTNPKGVGEMGLVLPLASDDLASMLRHDKVKTVKERKSIVMQLARAIAYLHSKDVLHGDIKPQNVLKYTHGGEDVYVLADLGIASTYRCYDVTNPFTAFTLWYRPVEVLLGGRYEPAGDVWALGCLTYEVLAGRPLFPGSDEMDQLYRVFRALGTPDRDTWPGVVRLSEWRESMPRWPTPKRPLAELDDESRRLVLSMVVMDPSRRPAVAEVLSDPWFDEVRAQMDRGYLAVKGVEEPVGGVGGTVGGIGGGIGGAIGGGEVGGDGLCTALLLARQSRPASTLLTLAEKERLEVWMSDRYVVSAPGYAPEERTLSTARLLCMELVGAEGVTGVETVHSIMDACVYLASIVPNETEAGINAVSNAPRSTRTGNRRASDKARVRGPDEIIQAVLRVHGTDLLAATSTDVLLVLLGRSGHEYPAGVRSVARVVHACTYMTLLHSRYAPDCVTLFCVLVGCSYARAAFGNVDVAQRVGRQAVYDVLVDFCSSVRELWLVGSGDGVQLSTEEVHVRARELAGYGGMTAEQVLRGTPVLSSLLGLARIV